MVWCGVGRVGMGGNVWKGGAHLRSGVCVEKGGDNGVWECVGDPGPGQGKLGKGSVRC